MSEKNEKINFKEIEQKIYRHEYLDGFTFAFLGFILILAAIAINLPPVFMVLLVVAFIAFFPISKELRSRFTYPRLGYFKVKTEDPKKLFPGIILFSSFIFISFIILLFIFTGGDPRTLYDYESWYRFMPIIFGLVMFGPSLDMVEKTGQKRYYSLGVFATILGVIITWLNLSFPKDGLTIYLLLLGSISCIVGVVTFVKFIKNYPILEVSEPSDIQEDNNGT
jgi:hypothetical protein